MAANLNRISAIKIKARNEYRYLRKEECAEIVDIKSKVVSCRYLPNELLSTIQLAYSKNCTKCKCLCTFGHVLRDHKLSKYALPELLERLQSAKARKSAKSDLKKIRATIIELTTK